MERLFSKNNFKFGTESFLIMHLNDYQIILGADLKLYAEEQTLFNEKSPCNIYFILKRPKVSIDPDSVIIDRNKAFLNAQIQIQNKFYPIDLSFEFNDLESELKFHSDYPYNLFTFSTSEEHLITARPGTLLDELYSEEALAIENLNYEILYIGQSYGKKGKRTALDRLTSHETLQKIYTESLTQNPDCDIWIMLCNFSQISILSSAGSDLVKVSEDDKKIEEEKAKNFFKNKKIKITDKQKINFTEASLIKYFEPKFNIEFKDSFPNKKHKSYSECYDLDIRSMAIELDTSDIQRKIYTKTSGIKSHHFYFYEFETSTDRYNLLNFK